MKRTIRRVSTKNMTDADWLAYRMNGIGGSEAGAILGLSPYTSSLEVFYNKLRRPVEKPENAAMFFGNELEDFVADLWRYSGVTFDETIHNKRNGKKQRDYTKVNAFLINPKFPHLFASVDRLIKANQFMIGSDEVQAEGILEVKTIGGFVVRQWEHGIPPSYVVQLQTYLAVTELSWGELIMLQDGRNVELIPFVRNEELINRIVNTTKEFYDRVTRAREVLKQEGFEYYDDVPLSHTIHSVIGCLEPPPDNSEAYTDYLKQRYKAEPITLNGDVEDYDTACEAVRLKEKVKDIESAINLCENKLKRKMETAERMNFGTDGYISYAVNAKGARPFTIRLRNK